MSTELLTTLGTGVGAFLAGVIGVMARQRWSNGKQNHGRVRLCEDDRALVTGIRDELAILRGTMISLIDRDKEFHGSAISELKNIASEVAALRRDMARAEGRSER